MRLNVVLALALALPVAPAAAQGAGGGSGVRLGVTFGGISRFGVVAEYFDDVYGIDLNVGTWRFGDLSLSVVGKRYFRSSTPNPYVGAGLWFVTSRPSDARRGVAAVLRVPLGLDWRVTGPHHLGATVNLNRAVLVRRTDPLDGSGPRGRIVPLPGLDYRLVL